MIKTSSLLIFFIIIFYGCTGEQKNLTKIKNAPVFAAAINIITDNKIPVKDQPVYMYFTTGNPQEKINVGNLKNGKLSFSLPSVIDEKHLIDFGNIFYSKTPGIKFASIQFDPVITLVNENNDIYFYFYSNKDGEFNYSGDIFDQANNTWEQHYDLPGTGDNLTITIKKGWNLINLLSKNPVTVYNINQLYRLGYKWHYLPVNY